MDSEFMNLKENPEMHTKMEMLIAFLKQMVTICGKYLILRWIIISFMSFYKFLVYNFSHYYYAKSVI